MDALKELGYLGWDPISTLLTYPGRKRSIARYSLLTKVKHAVAVMRRVGNYA